MEFKVTKDFIDTLYILAHSMGFNKKNVETSSLFLNSRYNTRDYENVNKRDRRNVFYNKILTELKEGIDNNIFIQIKHNAPEYGCTRHYIGELFLDPDVIYTTDESRRCQFLICHYHDDDGDDWELTVMSNNHRTVIYIDFSSGEITLVDTEDDNDQYVVNSQFISFINVMFNNIYLK